MQISKIKNLFFLFSLVLLISSCSKEEDPTAPETPEEPTPTLTITSNATLGNIVTDEEGRTLYFFSKDVAGNSECEGGCLTNWPAYYEVDLEAGTGVDAAAIGVITRADGSKQNTLNGWPLYYFSGDSQPGNTNGEGLGGNWFVAKTNYSMMIGETTIDDEPTQYLTDGNGQTLYIFTVDTENVSNCSDGCLSSWPPFFSSDIIIPSTIDASKFGEIDGNNGSKQLVFNAQPLYYFASDQNRGDVNGQGAGGNWFVLKDTDLSN